MPFITTSNYLWKDLLKRCRFDIYHSPEYAELQAEHTHGQAIAWFDLINGKSVLIPLIKRRIPVESLSNVYQKELFDLQSPYGYPGILTDSALLQVEADTILTKFKFEATCSGYISSFIRLNPFHNKWQITETDELTVKISGNIVVIHPAKDQAYSLWNKRISLNHYRNIERLKSKGFTVQLNGIDFLPQFSDAYQSLMKRKKAAEFYMFGQDYFSKLLSINCGLNFLMVVLSPENEFAAGAIFTHYNNIMQFQYGATNEKYIRLSPSKLLIETAIKKGIEAGAEFINLGGGYNATDNNTLFRFKKGFDKTGVTYDFRCLQIIHNCEIYHSLCASPSDYFPAYRDVNISEQAET